MEPRKIFLLDLKRHIGFDNQKKVIYARKKCSYLGIEQNGKNEPWRMLLPDHREPGIPEKEIWIYLKSLSGIESLNICGRGEKQPYFLNQSNKGRIHIQ